MTQPATVRAPESINLPVALRIIFAQVRCEPRCTREIADGAGFLTKPTERHLSELARRELVVRDPDRRWRRPS